MDWLAILLDRVTSLIGALSGLLVAAAALWQAISAKRAVHLLGVTTGARMDGIERRSGEERRKRERPQTSAIGGPYARLSVPKGADRPAGILPQEPTPSDNAPEGTPPHDRPPQP